MDINWFTLVPLIIQYGPEIQRAVQSLWNTASSNEDFIAKFEKALPAAAELANKIAGVFFPQASAAVGQIAATVLTFNTKFVTYVQKACNLAAQRGLITLDKPLAEDGSYGPMTHAAVKQLQTAIGGLTVDGIFGQKTWDAVKALKLPGLPATP